MSTGSRAPVCRQLVTKSLKILENPCNHGKVVRRGHLTSKSSTRMMIDRFHSPVMRCQCQSSAAARSLQNLLQTRLIRRATSSLATFTYVCTATPRLPRGSRRPGFGRQTLPFLCCGLSSGHVIAKSLGATPGGSRGPGFGRHSLPL